jgi:hypothetical protein
MVIAVLAEFMRDQPMIEDHVPHVLQLQHKFYKKMVTARLALDILELMPETETALETHVETENITPTLVPASNAQITSVLTTKTLDVSKILVALDKFKQLMVDVKIAQFIRNQTEARENVLH